MKICAPLFLALALATAAFADILRTTSRDANFRTDPMEPPPELRASIDQLNRDVKAWNVRCVVTNSDAEQSWCERERAALEARKAKIKSGIIPFATKGPLFPAVDVYLRYATKGKVLKQVTTDSTGHFDLGTFPASNYIMEFRAKRSPGVEHQRFAIQVDGIKSKGRQDGIPAKYLLGGFGIDVETAPGTRVAGQITTGSLAKTKKMIWLPREIGSLLPGHWVEEGSSQHVVRNNRSYYRIEEIRRMQDHNDY